MEGLNIQRAITEAKQNDQRAFVFLYDTFWDYLYGYLLKNTQNDQLAEELALKSLARAFDKIDTYNPDFEFKTWLISISKNLQIDHFRKENKESQLHTTSMENNEYKTIVDENPSPEDLLITNQNLKELLRKIKELKPTYAKVLRLRYFEELSYKEICVQTDLPISTVKVTLLRAKKLLAQKIKENGYQS